MSARSAQWHRTAPGCYQTRDGRYQIHDPQAAGHGPWYLAESDGNGGWQPWPGSYARKADAQAAVPAPYQVPPRTGRDARANPANKAGRYKETGEYIAASRRFVRGAGKRVADMDIDQLAALASLAGEAEHVLHDAALQLKDRGFTWAEIGKALGGVKPGTERQAAYSRFVRRSPYSECKEPA